MQDYTLCPWLSEYFGLFLNYFLLWIPKDLVEIIFTYVNHLSYRSSSQSMFIDLPQDLKKSVNSNDDDDDDPDLVDFENLGHDIHHTSLLIIGDDNQLFQMNCFNTKTKIFILKPLSLPMKIEENEKIFLHQDSIYTWNPEYPYTIKWCKQNQKENSSIISFSLPTKSSTLGQKMQRSLDNSFQFYEDNLYFYLINFQSHTIFIWNIKYPHRRKKKIVLSSDYAKIFLATDRGGRIFIFIYNIQSIVEVPQIFAKELNRRKIGY